jgi:hypothetical protein
VRTGRIDRAKLMLILPYCPSVSKFSPAAFSARADLQGRKPRAVVADQVRRGRRPREAAARNQPHARELSAPGAQ